MSSISNLVNDHTRNVVASYPSQAAPVVANLKNAIDQRVTEIAEALISGGTALGASREQVESLLVQAGLVEPTPEPEPEPVDESSDTLGQGRKSQRIAALEDTVREQASVIDSLKAFAARHGFRA